MTRGELMKLVTDNISAGCQMPVQFNEKIFNNEVDLAINYFKDNWDRAHQASLMLLSQRAFETPEFKSHRIVRLPDCISAVYGVLEFSSLGLLPSFYYYPFIDGVIFGDQDYSHPSEAMLFTVVNLSYLDFTRQFSLLDVQFDFNPNTHLLEILGRTPNGRGDITKDVLLRVYVTIPEGDLFEDSYFQRYIIARSKIQAGRSLAFFDFTLMNNVKLNTSVLLDEGREELEEVKEEMKKWIQPDYFLTFH